ncbi:MAG: GtrA family protein [Patescibacteria group bacterium]
MELKFTKKDFWLAVLAGEIITWLSLPTLKNVKILGLVAKWGIGLKLFMIFWVFLIPAGAILGLYLFYLMAKYKNQLGLLQMGKYGIIGVLNTFLNAGIYNFLIFITNIASGFTVDSFFVVAFVITVTNSFLWNRYWTFEQAGTETFVKDASQFLFVSAIVAVINIGILHIIINVIGAPVGMDLKIWANIALALTIITAFLGNFFGYKFIVFKK